MRDFSVAMTSETAQALADYLARPDGQEDVCFALYCPSTGRSRDSALITQPIFPEAGERRVHGNASFTTDYLRRALAIAESKGAGLALLHSHLPRSSGWQDLSTDDQIAEQRHASVVHSSLGLPFVGLTLAPFDNAWSARQWFAACGAKPSLQLARNVRVVGERLSITTRPDLRAQPQATQVRTVSFWGSESQSMIASLTVGIIGLGSVGSLVGELLSRSGVQRLVLIDFDEVEEKNLDRMITAAPQDIGRKKVDIAAERFAAVATAANFEAHAVCGSITVATEFKSLLDCDVVFSCVDRPWPRHVMNRAAYSHLVPVIDGGILVRFRPGGDQLLNVDWSVQIAGPGKPCLICQNAYRLEDVSLEQSGLLDDEGYIQGLSDDSPLKRRENIVALSASVASFEVLRLAAMVSGAMQLPDPGQQRYSYYPGNVRLEPITCCQGSCTTPSFLARGDSAPSGAREE